jgi:hypothetical protein
LTSLGQDATIRLLSKFRQIAACCLLLIALIHVGGEPVTSIFGLSSDLTFGCDSLGISEAPSNESQADDCDDSCCFCCCSHVIGESNVILAGSDWRPAELALISPYRPDESVQPGLLPPRG